MIAVIKGDIVASRTLDQPEKWLAPLKKLLSKWGKSPEKWELAWGDSFQVEIEKPEEALYKALLIKALIKKTKPGDNKKTTSTIDVRMSIGIGEKTYAADRISESNGPAFVHAGEKFAMLKKEKTNLAIQSPWSDFDKEINLYLKLASIIMDNWSVSSAELMEVVFNQPEATQKKIGRQLGIKQNSVSGRWNRAKADEILAIEEVYRNKLKYLVKS